MEENLGTDPLIYCLVVGKARRRDGPWFLLYIYILFLNALQPLIVFDVAGLKDFLITLKRQRTKERGREDGGR